MADVQDSIDLSGLGLTDSEVAKRLKNFGGSSSRVEFIFLDRNRICEVPLAALEAFPRLRWLDMRNNRIEMTPSNLGRRNDQLETVLLQGNPLKELPSDASFSNTLKVIQTDRVANKNEKLQGRNLTKVDVKDVDWTRHHHLDSGVGSSLDEEEADEEDRVALGHDKMRKKSHVGVSVESQEAVVDASARRDNWTLLPAQWNAVKKAMHEEEIEQISPLSRFRPLLPDRRRKKDGRRFSRAVITSWPDEDAIEKRARKERQQKEEMVANMQIDRRIQRVKDAQFLARWRKKNSWGSEGCSTIRRPPPVGLDRNKQTNARGRDPEETCLEAYERLLDDLNAEVEAVLCRRLDRIDLEDLEESQRELHRISGERCKLLCKIRTVLPGNATQK